MCLTNNCQLTPKTCLIFKILAAQKERLVKKANMHHQLKTGEWYGRISYGHWSWM